MTTGLVTNEDTSMAYPLERLFTVKEYYLMAEAGVLQYCLVNLNSLQIEDHRNPTTDGYSQRQIYADDQSFYLAFTLRLFLKLRSKLRTG